MRPSIQDLARRSSGASISARTGKANQSHLLDLWALRLTVFHIGLPPRIVGGSHSHLRKYFRKGHHSIGSFSKRPWTPQQHQTIALLVGAQEQEEAMCSEYEKTIGYSIHAARRITALERRLRSRPWLGLLEANLRANLEAINEVLRLDDVELRCLVFLLLVASDSRLAFACNVLECELSDQQTFEAIADAIGANVIPVQKALSSEGRLAGCQLVKINSSRLPLGLKFDWVSPKFPAEMFSPDFQPLHALRDRIALAPKGSLSWEDFDHLAEVRDITFNYIDRALKSGRHGVNILLHSPPGCGKSEFVRMLAGKVGCALYEVSTQDEDGDPINSTRRLQALRVAQGFCAKQNCLLVFDEIEDVLPAFHSDLGAALRPPLRKGWINRMLESNPCITFWLTNAPEGLDRAFTRRFDLVWEIKGPHQAIKEAQLRSLPIALPEASVQRFASCTDLSSAVISRAASVVEAVQESLGVGQVAKAFESIITHNLLAQRLHVPRGEDTSDEIYDPDLINCATDLREISRGIARAPSARLCLYGPPGTGKSAFARWLADHLKRPLHTKRASDLLSPYVGQAEMNIAKAFRDAGRDGAVLVIDEVDSFLRDRTNAVRSWEVSLVNEFLVQMEEFAGVLIATTNLLEGTDTAAWRRFDLTLRFDYLRPAQAEALLDKHLSRAALPPAGAEDQRMLASLQRLTPGHFAMVSRQSKFSPPRSASEWIEKLAVASQGQPAQDRRILGFSRTTSS